MEIAVQQQLSTYNIIDFGVKPFKKGIAGFKRTESFVCTLNRRGTFFTTSKVYRFQLFRAAEPKILSKKKKLPYRKRFKGKPSLAGLPLFLKQSPGLFEKFTLFGAHFVQCESEVRKFFRAFFIDWKSFGDAVAFEKAPQNFSGFPLRQVLQRLSGA